MNKYVRIFGISDGGGTYFRGPCLLSRGMIRWSEKSCKEEIVQSSAFRRLHAVVHVSAIMHILPGYRGTYIWGMYFRAIAANSKFQ